MSDWELVLRGGRAIDPETGLDAVQDVAVDAGQIAAIGTALPSGQVEVDVAGQVVTAGFIRPGLSRVRPGQPRPRRIRHRERASNAAMQ